MSDVLNKNLFLVKEHVGMFKAASNFDIFDPETGATLMECREDGLGFFTKMFRFTKYKKMTPFNIIIRDQEGKQIIRVNRGLTLFLSKVSVFDANDQVIGGFKQKLFSLGGAFNVMDNQDNQVCSLKGKWTGWDFKFLMDDNQLAHVSKKWAGLGKELFTSADNYVLEVSDSVPADHVSRKLILAAVMCIDLVLKE
ncbi:phospholipid scramblase-related protein [Desulfoluna sp.]|uniref:phospholipid scramblase-related protein n=1 Tax=Desulfoluna sp. TaxID=2045199 RepID=UPI0026195710|nr:phospholipid scramblase-related protein [Desulfoluna sp.]